MRLRRGRSLECEISMLVIGTVLGVGAAALLTTLLMAKNRAVPDQVRAYEDREQMRAVYGQRRRQSELETSVKTIH
jgi:hypothetical protein